MQKIESLLSTLEIAEMLEIEHWQLLRKLNGRTNTNGNHVKGYVEILGDNQMVVTDFFRKSTYITDQNKEMPCYQVTRKGCEFLANKFTGEKGVLFTARYINRFHEMQDLLSQQELEPELPWFIRKFRGKYIMLFRDFEAITGVNLENYTSSKRSNHLILGFDFNGWAWHTAINREQFLNEYGFDYGDDDCMFYLNPCGIRRVLALYKEDCGRKINQEAYDMIADGLNAIHPSPKKEIAVKKQDEITSVPPIQIRIIVEK